MMKPVLWFFPSCNKEIDVRSVVQDLFSYFDWVLCYCAEHLGHAVFQVTLSVNSPSE